jgi:hypothetical protein
MSVLLDSGLLPGTIYVESEFIISGVHGACGPNALAMGESRNAQAYVSTPSVYNRMRAAKRCDANGVSNMSGIEAQAQADGFKTTRRDASAGWRDWCVAQLQAGAVVIYEPSKGQALHDEISGLGMNASGLAYHFNLMVGYWLGGMNSKAGKSLDEGFWMADGDNGAVDTNPGAGSPVINGRARMVNGRRVQFYTRATIAASAPYAFMAVYPKIQIGGQSMAGVPSGWSDDGTTLKAPNGIAVIKGFRNGILHAGESGADIPVPWEADNWPLAPEYTSASIEPGNPAIGAGSRQDFRKGSLGWTESKNVYRIWVGQDVQFYAKALADAKAQIAALQAQVGAGVQLTAAQKADLAAMAGIRAALKA